MNKAAALKLLEVYENKITNKSNEIQIFIGNAVEVLNRYPETVVDSLGHCYTMFPRMRLMIQYDVEKFCRWLGFIQAVFWMEKIYTVEQLKDHNRAVFAGKPNVIFDDRHLPHSKEDEEGYG